MHGTAEINVGTVEIDYESMAEGIVTNGTVAAADFIDLLDMKVGDIDFTLKVIGALLESVDSDIDTDELGKQFMASSRQLKSIIKAMLNEEEEGLQNESTDQHGGNDDNV